MTTTKTVTIRLPIDLYRAVVALADKDRRSINQQLVYLCQRGLVDLQMAGNDRVEGGAK